jgi:light-regulated signal transduction histidine kinase (bacteriophytochrome)
MLQKFAELAKKPWLRIGFSYLFMFLCVALFVWLKLMVLGGVSRDTPYLFILFSVFISAFYGGFGPGVAATLLSLVAIYYYFLPPYFEFDLLYTSDFEEIITYIMVGFAFSWLLDQQREYKSDLEKIIDRRTGQLHKANEELQRSNKELEDFAYIASHDLQEPLRKILAFGDRFESRYKDQLSEDAIEYLDRMLRSAQRMRVLVEGLLTYARVASKDIPYRQVELQSLIREVLDDMEVTIEEQKAEVVVHELPAVEANPIQLTQVFQNLIGNSLKFHKPNEPARVNIEGEIIEDGEQKKYARVRVADQGIGIPDEYQDKIFNIFQRLHGRSAYEGTGIGLAVVRRIIERHNGAIRVFSKEGKGTTFEMDLPLVHRHK